MHFSWSKSSIEFARRRHCSSGIEAVVISMIIFGVGVSAANFQALLLNKVDAEMMCATSRQH